MIQRQLKIFISGIFYYYQLLENLVQCVLMTSSPTISQIYLPLTNGLDQLPVPHHVRFVLPVSVNGMQVEALRSEGL